jgi:hypothetical protein
MSCRGRITETATRSQQTEISRTEGSLQDINLGCEIRYFSMTRPRYEPSIVEASKSAWKSNLEGCMMIVLC